MKAIVVTKHGGPEVLNLADATVPKVEPGQVLVRIKVAGVNYIDVYQRSMSDRSTVPFTPGREASGVVESVGSKAKRFKTGDRVAFSGEIGAYSEYIAVNEDRLIPLPEKMSFEQGAAFPLQGMTAQYLLFEFRKITPGTTVLIHAAAGGMGLLLVQWAKHLGATVYGTVSTKEKAELAKQAGADHVINYAEDDFVSGIRALTDGKGVELIIDGVGKTTFTKDLDAVSNRGTVVIYGAASGPADPIYPNALQPKSITVCGGSLFNYIVTQKELETRSSDVIKGITEGWLTLKLDHVFPLHQASESHRLLESRKSTGKILLSV
jgi:NADPH2:quinone reductase